jgi:hypothetical protein
MNFTPRKRPFSSLNGNIDFNGYLLKETKSTDLYTEDEKFLCDVVFSFDTTGSMSSVIESVRNNLSETIERLFREVEGIRIGILSHGDYCDNVTVEKLELTKNVEQIKKFIKESKNTGGGDADECYEYILNLSKNMNWKSDVKILVMIGDENPHEKGYRFYVKNKSDLNNFNIFNETGELQIDWKEEIKFLKENKIIVFSCHALPEINKSSLLFYNQICEETGGFYFPLDELQGFKDYMVAICFKAADAGDTLQIINKKREELRKIIEEENKKISEFDEKLNLFSQGKIDLSQEEYNDLNLSYSRSVGTVSKAKTGLNEYDVNSSVSIFTSPIMNKLNTNSRTITFTNKLKSKNKLSSATNTFISTISQNNETIDDENIN